MIREIVIVTGGDELSPQLAHVLPDHPFVIAADSGLHLARAIGLTADLVVGDFDSVDADSLRDAERDGATIERHPVAKDRTDLEIALDAALRFAPAHAVVVGGHGGRVDHFLGNLLLLAAPRFAELQLEAYMGDAHVRVVRDRVELRGELGEVISLLPVNGAARGVRTEGLLYPLHGDDLVPGSTRGVSNELESTRAVVTVDDGVLLAVQPGVLGSHLHDTRTPPMGET